MSNNRLVRDNNSARIPGKKRTTKKSNDVVSKVAEKISPIEVTHGNAPLLTVKYLELILKEIKLLTAKLEKMDG